MKKSLTALDLTVFGVGVVIGAGIFTLTGRAAHEVAGPAILISFIVAAIACALAALCYAEFASTVPVSGSAYTFSYSSLGELFAWIIGWDLILEMFLGASVVAQGWSAYLGTLLAQLGAPIPAVIGYGGTVDLMAILLVVVLGGIITFGIKESLRVNLVLVAVKLFIVLFVIIAGVFFIDPANWSPFIPDAAPRESATGLSQPLLQFLSGVEPTAFGIGGIFARCGTCALPHRRRHPVREPARPTRDHLHRAAGANCAVRSPGIKDGRGHTCRDRRGDRRHGVFCDPRSTLATRQQRIHQPAAARLFPKGTDSASTPRPSSLGSPLN